MHHQPAPQDLSAPLRASGTDIVDASGTPLQLRGVGLGNWLLPEGYMWKFGPGAESPREIEAFIERLAGPEYAAHFWARFRAEFIAESDIAMIAACGFDHVRVPINARVIQDADGEPIEAGYALIDRLIGWCRAHGIRALLDLHGAPGGQTGTNIDDSLGRPDLFLTPGNRELTVRLWADMASRYADEPVVMGYDLLNEPLPHEWRYSLTNDLVSLYSDVTEAIRAVDTSHLIMYEGTHWATDFSMFTERWDDNQVLQFHRYWSSPDKAGIAPYLEARSRLGVPLYMGEGGENTPEWLYTVTRLYESERIGWNFWPWKKVDTTTSPLSVEPPPGWELVLASIGGDAKLTQARAAEVFEALLDGFPSHIASWQPDVVPALLAREPRRIPAWGFGFRCEGESYGGAGTSALAGIRADDAVAVRFVHPSKSSPENPFSQGDGRTYLPQEELMVELPAGGWLEYELDGPADPAQWSAVDPHGRGCDATVTSSPRGIRVTAGTEGARIAHIVFGTPAATLTA